MHNPRLLLAIGTAALAALLAVALVLLVRQPDRDPAAVLAAQIEAETAKLATRPPAHETTAAKAQKVRRAIAAGDYPAARQLVAEVLGGSRMQSWRFYPFESFGNGIVDIADPGFAGHLSAWVKARPDDAIPVLVRARYYLDLGWFHRGENFIRDMQPGHVGQFQDDMANALADIDAAIRIDPGNPYAHYLKLRILHGDGASIRLQSAFEAAIARFPGYYPLYDIVLGTLEPRWGGTVPAMFDFVDRHAGRAAENSPLKLLYVTLYRDLLSQAGAACSNNWRDQDKMAQCVAALMDKSVTPDLERQVAAALRIYDHTDRQQFGLLVGGLLADMLKVSGGAPYAGTILQLAAEAMHSNTQLNEQKPGRNDFVIDQAVAQSWYQKSFFDNALHKDQEALKDVAATAFPDEEQKDLALAGIYARLAEDNERLRQYVPVIAYEQAAIALGGATGEEHYVCYAYYQLKLYREAVKSCSRSLADDPSNVPARYWRASAYKAISERDAALRDFTAVAESENGFRSSAAIALSMLYFDRKDLHGALNVLTKYTYLYNQNVTGKDDIAVAYNNRCYALMELGQLKQALGDCTASLKYGSLPEAIRKRQELIRRLDAHETGL